MFVFKKANSIYQQFSSKKDRELATSIRRITGKQPVNLALYKQAVCHSSVAPKNQGGTKDSYERLEYLGDAILGMVVAELLFAKFPFKEEGFLTELRARIVSRESLNGLCQKIGLSPFVKYGQQNGPRHKSVYGDVMEALVGAYYLDHGFAPVRRFIIQRLIQPHYDFDELLSTTQNFKSKIIEWAQKENRNIEFEMVEERGESSDQFIVRVLVDGEPVKKGFGFNKKKAEQDAARKSITELHIEH